MDSSTPISAETLGRAVERGIITADQRGRLLALESAAAEPATAGGGDEQLRLIGGGNDLFVTVGIVMLFAGIVFAMQAMPAISTAAGAAVIGVLIWLVAEFVTRQRRMRLASTVLGLGFVACTGLIAGDYLYTQANLDQLRDNPAALLGLRSQIGWLGSLAGGAVVAAAIVYFWRFRVPVMAAVLAVALTTLAFLWTFLIVYDGVMAGQIALPTAAEQVSFVLERALYVPLVCGLAVFGTAVALDLHDRERFTVWSDCAFWLHVVSAPLLVHPLFILATGRDFGIGTVDAESGATAMLALLIAGFVYIALAIDRRSLLVPTFAYFGSLGVYYLFDNAANTTGIPPFALILLMIGALVIMFGAGWQRIRALVVGTTLPASVLAKLPPIETRVPNASPTQ